MTPGQEVGLSACSPLADPSRPEAAVASIRSLRPEIAQGDSRDLLALGRTTDLHRGLSLLSLPEMLSATLTAIFHKLYMIYGMIK